MSVYLIQWVTQELIYAYITTRQDFGNVQHRNTLTTNHYFPSYFPKSAIYHILPTTRCVCEQISRQIAMGRVCVPQVQAQFHECTSHSY